MERRTRKPNPKFVEEDSPPPTTRRSSLASRQQTPQSPRSGASLSEQPAKLQTTPRRTPSLRRVVDALTPKRFKPKSNKSDADALRDRVKVVTDHLAGIGPTDTAAALNKKPGAVKNIKSRFFAKTREANPSLASLDEGAAEWRAALTAHLELEQNKLAAIERMEAARQAAPHGAGRQQEQEANAGATTTSSPVRDGLRAAAGAVARVVGKARRAKTGASDAEEWAYTRINFMGGPMLEDETDDAGSPIMDWGRKKEIIWATIEDLTAVTKAAITDWENAGMDVNNPPRLTTLAHGCEEGTIRGKLHLQLTAEYWHKKGLSENTVKKQFRAYLQPFLDKHINLERGEVFMEMPITRLLANPTSNNFINTIDQARMMTIPYDLENVRLLHADATKLAELFGDEQRLKGWCV